MRIMDDPKLRLEDVADNWGCTTRHILNLEKAGKIKLMRLSPRMVRVPLSEKVRFEKEGLGAAPDSATGDRLVDARKRKAREAVA